MRDDATQGSEHVSVGITVRERREDELRFPRSESDAQSHLRVDARGCGEGVGHAYRIRDHADVVGI